MTVWGASIVVFGFIIGFVYTPAGFAFQPRGTYIPPDLPYGVAIMVIGLTIVVYGLRSKSIPDGTSKDHN